MQLYEAYRGAGLTVEAFEGIQFKRIAQLQHLIDEHKLDGSTLRWLSSEAVSLTS
jgi:hypothetical protein